MPMDHRTQRAPRVSEVTTIDDLAAYLWISKLPLEKLAQAGNVPGRKAGKHWRFYHLAVDRWLGNDSAADRGNRPLAAQEEVRCLD
jgi:excisionase family DNA binding protein